MRRVKCKVCPKELGEKRMKVHEAEHSLKYHKSAAYCCHECQLWFECAVHENLHLSVCHPSHASHFQQEPKRIRLSSAEGALPQRSIDSEIPEAAHHPDLPDSPGVLETDLPGANGTTSVPFGEDLLQVPLRSLEDMTLEELSELFDTPDLDDLSEHLLPDESDSQPSFNQDRIFNSLEEFLFYVFYQQEGANRLVFGVVAGVVFPSEE